MKSKFLKVLFLLLAFFFCHLNASAVISSEADMMRKINQLKTLSQYDYLSLVNKNELIGYRLDSFNMASSQYKNSTKLVIDNFNSILFQIDTVRNSSDFSDSDKQIQINKLYQDADSALYNLDSQTINYLFSLRTFMPPITYQRYVKKFQSFYNEFQLTNNEISIK